MVVGPVVNVGCGGEDTDGSSGGATTSLPPVTVREEQAFMTVQTLAEAEDVCERMQAAGGWPTDAKDKDVVYILLPSGENEISCGKP
jgi:hypothetical protein